MAKKRKEHCAACGIITTQTFESGEWKCLCCESAKFRSGTQTKHIREKNLAKPKALFKT